MSNLPRPRRTKTYRFKDKQLKLVNGDCLRELAKLPSACADLVVADPPYGVSLRSRRFPPVANDDKPFIWWIYEASRILKPTGCMLCFTRWDVEHHFRWAIELTDLKIRSQVIWNRQFHGAGNTKAAFSPMHDTIWFATKREFVFVNGKPRSVVSAPKPLGRRHHPMEKPVSLLRDLISYVAQGDALVVDPFLGSGATALACIDLNLNLYAIELTDSYCNVAHTRVRNRLQKNDL